MKVALLDFETTGLDPATSQIIEGAVSLIDVGTWNVESSYSGLNDPGCEVPAEITEITGLQTADVRGRRLDVDRFVDIAGRADLVISHNARFDRGFYQRYVAEPAVDGIGEPALSPPWACSLMHIDWQALRMPCRNLRHLAFELGHMVGAGHRAADDVATLALILGTPNPRTGILLIEELLEAAQSIWTVVKAFGAPFSVKDALRKNGFRWSGGSRVWWKSVREEGLPELAEWMLREIYGGDVRAAVQKRCTKGVDILAPDFEERYQLR